MTAPLAPAAEAPTPEAPLIEEPEATDAGGFQFYQNRVTKQIFRVKGELVESLVSDQGWSESQLPPHAVAAFDPIVIDPLVLEGLQFGEGPKDADLELAADTSDFATASPDDKTELADIATDEELEKPMEGGRFRIPLVIPEGVPSTSPQVCPGGEQSPRPLSSSASSHSLSISSPPTKQLVRPLWSASPSHFRTR